MKWSRPLPAGREALVQVPTAGSSQGGGGLRLAQEKKEQGMASLCLIHPQTLHHSTMTPPVSHLDPAYLFPSGELSGMQGGRVGATHVIEHFVELLGFHDKVGVAYHVVDCIRLDRRDTGQ